MLRTGLDSFHTRGELELDGTRYLIHQLGHLPGLGNLPLSLRIILENLLRHEDGQTVTAADIERLLRRETSHSEIQFAPSRVFLHDTNGVPVLADLAALRDALAAAGGDPELVHPAIPGELTVDHSVSTDFAGRPDAQQLNIAREYERNAERYRFLKWGSELEGLVVIPPGGGIMHQINLERLARVVERRDGWAYPDTCLGTDSHTTMVNGLGVLGWGIGGVEAEAALLGLPVSIVVPRVVGVELMGELGTGVTATDLVLTVTEMLRSFGVVGSIVEFFGAGITSITVETRATISNMAPEYGATSAMFPVDDATLAYLRLTGRPPGHILAVERYCKEQQLWHRPQEVARYDARLALDLGSVEPSMAGPRRPQDRVPLGLVPKSFLAALEAAPPTGASPGRGSGEPDDIADGAVAIASITSCTNTSNPGVMVAAGLLARNARRRGLTARPWVKTSLAPGSKAVTQYLDRAGLSRYLDELGFQNVGYGCMTCIGNSGALLPTAELAVRERGVVVASVLSGNRNFDGRINNDVQMNYLASPPLVVAYAIAGSVRRNLLNEPLGDDPQGRPVYLADVWPDDAEVREIVRDRLTPEIFASAYAQLFAGDEQWQSLPHAQGALFPWDPDSTYLRPPPFLAGADQPPTDAADIVGAHVLAQLGDSVTTDHISPAGRIPTSSLAAQHLMSRGVARRDLNTYASRRGNFEVMTRGAFSNPRLRNLLLSEERGGLARAADGSVVPMFQAAESYRRQETPLVIIAGKEYGSGSSRDWAAKVTSMLGVKAVLAVSFERIHRANLVQMGVLPLEFLDGQSGASLGLDGSETIDLTVIPEALEGHRGTVRVTIRAGARRTDFDVRLRVDTTKEVEYYRHGGLLPFVYRTLLQQSKEETR